MKLIRRLFPPDRLFLRFFTGWCAAALVETLCIPHGFLTGEFFANILLWRFALVLIAVMALLTAVSLLRDTAVTETRLMMAVSLFYCLTLAYAEHYFYFALCLALVLLLIGVYALQKDRLRLQRVVLSDRMARGIIAAAAVFFAVFTAAVTVCRYRGYSSSTFDLGIFSQMFHYMKTTGLPLTTCERDRLLSHFAVHISPIWYLLLPFYAVFPSPITLQVMQSLILASAVIPLYLIARRVGLSRRAILIVCVCFCFFPALSGGQFYDVHENFFLTPLLLWLLYFYEKDNWVPVWCFAILTLMVKEDAAVYVAAVALYLLFARREYRHGSALLLVSIAWFFLAAALLNRFGEGAMTASRFGPYLMGQESGMLAVVKNIFLNPGYLFFEVFREQKVTFILQMLLPLTFLPLYGKKLSRLLLFIPMLAVNLMPDWEYQYSIFFQYVFGSIALLFYLTVLNLRDMSAARRRFMLPLAAVFTALLWVSQISGYADQIVDYAVHYERNSEIAAILDTIPDDASVAANGFYLPSLSDRAVIYDYASGRPAEYIVLDLRPDAESDAAENDAFYRSYAERYICVGRKEEAVAVYRDTLYQAETP